MRRFNSILVLSSALIMASCSPQANKQATTAVVVDEAPKVTVTKVYAENVPQLSTYPTTVEAEVINNITPQSASRINEIFVEIHIVHRRGANENAVRHIPVVIHVINGISLLVKLCKPDGRNLIQAKNIFHILVPRFFLGVNSWDFRRRTAS